MVNTIERYECEVCGGTYSEINDARACEAQGKPTSRFKLGVLFLIKNGKRKGQTVKVIRLFYSEHHKVSYHLEVQDSPDGIHWGFQVSEDEALRLMMESVIP